jgi:MoaA/NifB/PqqE/SkfB family radical SAM enzyme
MNSIEFNNSPFDLQKKLLFHPDRIHEYITSGDTVPIVMEVNLTDVCNMKCSYCFCDHRNNNTLNVDIVLDFLRDFKKIGGKAITYSGGGDPTLHKQFKQIVEYTSELGLEQGLITNGAFKSDLIETIGNNFKWVRISIDTINEELFKQIRGVNLLDRVLNNVYSLKDYKCKLGLNCNVTSDMSVYSIEELIHMKNDVDYIQFRPVLPRFIHKENIEINTEVWDYLKTINDKKIILSFDKFSDLANMEKSFPFRACDGHFLSPILDSNGDVKVCMYHPGNKNFTFGNLYQKSLKDIWTSEERKRVIEYVRDFDYYGNCQVCCKLFEINKFLDYVKYPNEILDINFL